MLDNHCFHMHVLYLPNKKKEKKRKHNLCTTLPCIYFKGRNQLMQAHPFQLVLNTNANFLAKVAHLIISVKK